MVPRNISLSVISIYLGSGLVLHTTTINTDTFSDPSTLVSSISAKPDLPVWFVAVIIAVLFWVFDAYLYCYIFTPGGSLIDAIFLREPFELWMRCVVSVMIISFGVYADRTIIRHKRMQELLETEIERRKQLEKSLREIANTDSLTSVYNRRRFYKLLNREMKRVKRYGGTFSIILCDLDHFKEINDRFGHHVGDAALRGFCDTVKSHMRSSDSLARLGGEEFVVLTPNTAVAEAKVKAERLRKLARNYIIEGKKNLSVSVGVTEYQEGDDSDSLLMRADRAMYGAKARGRNKVITLE